MTTIYDIFLGLIIFVILAKIFNELTTGRNYSNVYMAGKTVIITGGRSGMGFETAMVLAGRGARVILGDRGDSSKAIKTIIEKTKNPNVIGKYIDLADLSTVRAFAEDIVTNEERLDVLINNAGMAGDVKGITKDGLPLAMQTNHLGPFLLTHLLIGKLKQSAPSRIIFVSSSSAYTAFLKVDDLTKPFKPTTYFSQFDNYLQYSNTKVCNAIASAGFAKRLVNSGVTCNALHPGNVSTPLVAKFMSCEGNVFAERFWYGAATVFAKTPRDGVQTCTYLAMADEVKNISGKFFVDCIPFIQPFTLLNKKLCEEVWRKSEELVKLLLHEKL